MSRWKGIVPVATVGLIVALLAVYPVPLLPLARAYQTVCEQHPVLPLFTFHMPPAPFVLLLGVASLGLLVGIWKGAVAVVHTHRFNQHLRRNAIAVPPRLTRLAAELRIADRITYLTWGQPAACCYGFTRPHIAITAELVARLDDDELIAVLAHERQHLRRRDPVRYLALYALSAGAFMFPVATALRQRQEARIELAADRAAIAVAPRGALAGAMLAVLAAPRIPVAGVASLTATEARIAQLNGRNVLPELPARLVAASLGLALVILMAAVTLASSSDLVAMVCDGCVRWI